MKKILGLILAASILSTSIAAMASTDTDDSSIPGLQELIDQNKTIAQSYLYAQGLVNAAPTAISAIATTPAGLSEPFVPLAAYQNLATACGNSNTSLVQIRQNELQIMTLRYADLHARYKILMEQSKNK